MSRSAEGLGHDERGAHAPREDDLFPWEQVDAAPEQTVDRTAGREDVENPSPQQGEAGRGALGTPLHPNPPPLGQGADGGEMAAALEGALEHAAPGTSSPNRPIAPREYYSISEVCELVGLKPHVLRYWESQFSVLNPSKNRSGNRVYQRKEIRLIVLVKQLLYDEKYTVEGARAKLERLRRGAQLGEATEHVLEPQLIELLRQDLDELKAILTPPAR